MPLTGMTPVEQAALGAMLATARDDTDGVAQLLLPLSPDELIGLAAYCARFAVVLSGRLEAATGEDTLAGLRAYARFLALRAG